MRLVLVGVGPDQPLQAIELLLKGGELGGLSHGLLAEGGDFFTQVADRSVLML